MLRRNNFDAVRLLAAAVVIFGHAHPLTSTPGPGFLGNSVQAVAVKIFFVVSGYLICASWTIDPSLPHYLTKRSLRIFPALFVICVLTIFVAGPMFTSLPIDQYFGYLHTYGYFKNVLMNPVYDLPGVFVDNLYPTAVNGSLWSLPIEFAMYLVLPALYEIGRRLGMKSFLLVITIILCAFSVKFVRLTVPAIHPVVYGSDLISALDVAPYFLIGATIKHMNWERFLDPIFALFLVALVALVPPTSATLSEIVLYFVLPYAVLALALFAHPLLSKAGVFGDFSYGLYLYGFLIQQSVAHLTHNQLTALQNALVSLPLALVCAITSWHLIEKPMLRLKPRPRLSAANTPIKEVTHG